VQAHVSENVCLEKFVAAGERVFVYSPQLFDTPQEIDSTVEDFVSGLVQYLFNECAHTRMCGGDDTKVVVSGNKVLGSSAHAEIQITGGYEHSILEGQPDLATGRLVSRSNGANAGEAFVVSLSPPDGYTNGSFAWALRTAAGRYGNNLSYAFPVLGSDSSWQLMNYGYNSNSYVSGVLKSVYGFNVYEVPAAAFANGYHVPGWYKPIPLR